MGVVGLNVLVAGGGIAGWATALVLQKRGARVEVLEQAATISEVGAGIQISPNGMRVLIKMGLDHLVTARRGQAVSLRDYAAGREVLRLDLTRLGKAPGYWFVHRADLIDALSAAALEAGVGLSLGTRVLDVSAGHRPWITLEDGSTRTADLVIGADGVHSQIRQRLNGASDPVFSGQVAWRATLPNVTGHPDEARVHMGPGRHLVSYPLRGGTLLNLVAVEERAEWTAEGWHHSDSAVSLARSFSSFGGDVPVWLSALDGPPGLWGLFRHPVAERWGAEGVGLVGDAAHPTLPFLAQGGNMALEDAWALCAAIGAHDNLTNGLVAYQHIRKPRVTQVIAAADGNAWKYHLRNPVVRGAAHLGLRLAGRLAPSRFLRGFDWLYGYDVTEDQRFAMPLARAPS